MTKLLSQEQFVLDQHELACLLICTTRYALGRASYIVSEVCQLLLKHRGSLPDWQVQKIVKEIETELVLAEWGGKTLGHQQDHDLWKRLVKQLKSGV